MGAMFRSEEMALCQLFIQPEAAYPSIALLGEAGIVQFRDLNSEVNAFHRKFVSEVRRCDEMERKLRYIEAEVLKDKVAIPESTVNPAAPNPREIIDLEAHLERTESEILESSHNAVNLKFNYLELTELKHLLEKTHNFFQELDLEVISVGKKCCVYYRSKVNVCLRKPVARGSRHDHESEGDIPFKLSNLYQVLSEPGSKDTLSVPFQQQEGGAGDSLTKALIADDSQQVSRGRLGFVAGVVPRERVPAFERMLWRISRGNVFLRQAELEEPLEDPNTGNPIWKTVFVAFFQGEQLKSRVKKVCSGFHASFYPCPSTYAERQDMVKGVKARLEDLNLVLNQTKDHRQRVLVTVAKELHNWSVMVRKMKAIYHTLNLFNMDVTKKCLIGECWVPVKDLPTVRKALADGSNAVGSSIPSFLNVIETSEDPPTFNRTNRFTQGFQNLIDSYGIATYREVNPALYTIITFPFLFAIMFGDAGHGLILTLFGAWMVIWEQSLSRKKTHNEIWNIFFGGRYIILLMGLFSIYTGIIYNDVFSKMLNVFGSSWKINYNKTQLMTNKDFTLDPRFEYIQIPYPVGLDPVWQSASNKIVFLNSYKMKLSIIFGVVHMMFGVTLSVINHVHFRRPMSILLEYLPQMVFLTLLFFYMTAMMFIKWVMYAPRNELKTSPRCAPSVLILFINMMLFKPGVPFEGCDEFMFSGQKTLQTVFVLVALLCVPVMLFGKPIYLLCCGGLKKHRKVPVSYSEQAASNGDLREGIELQPSGPPVPEPEEPDESEAPAEIFIHQAIHTIEYVLSTVSHTASYLRLWALSLAHAQLSEVLWSMVLRKGLESESHWGAITLYVSFAAWASFTIAILVMMEGLSAFLHTLRLHWVEFMSKFYEGGGYLFQPFSFKHILEAEESPEE